MTKTIQGFVRAAGTHLVNDAGPLLLKGWGIGNWLLPEGYMWLSAGNLRLDRPRRIQEVLQELTGTTFATHFWSEFQKNYFTLADVQYIKAQGYNSIRLPLHWELFLADEPGIHFQEAGFQLLREVVAWCKACDLYLILDLHGAPGGQTGANIDDSVDDLPRLFLDQEQFAKGVALWTELARRFAHEEVIAAYDLLNEPVKPGYDLQQETFFVARLKEFYEKTITGIRQWDSQHLLSLEGHHWATNPEIFQQRYDENYLIHFHRYATYPDEAAFQEFLALREKWQVPLWLGETGENLVPWFSAMTQLCEKYDVSYHFWPYKKLGKTNGSVTIPTPQHWEQLIAYANGGPHPSYEVAQTTLTEFLTAMQWENCQKNPEVDAAILRNGPYTLQATDFIASSCYDQAVNTTFDFHKDEEVRLVEVQPPVEKRFSFDINWDRFRVELTAGDTLTYGQPNYRPQEISLFYEGGAGVFTCQGIQYATSGKGVIHHVFQPDEELKIIQLAGQQIFTQLDFL